MRLYYLSSLSLALLRSWVSSHLTLQLVNQISFIDNSHASWRFMDTFTSGRWFILKPFLESNSIIKRGKLMEKRGWFVPGSSPRRRPEIIVEIWMALSVRKWFNWMQLAVVIASDGELKNAFILLSFCIHFVFISPPTRSATFMANLN